MSDLHEALLDLQQNLPQVAKSETADTGKFTYDYATLPKVHEALLPLLHARGLLWTVAVRGREAVGTLRHVKSGETEDTGWPMPSTDDPQRLGSALTYARRYLLCALVGLVPDGDDDGQAAGTPTKDELKAQCAPHGVVDVDGLLGTFEGDVARAVDATTRWSDETWSRAAEKFGGDQ